MSDEMNKKRMQARAYKSEKNILMQNPTVESMILVVK